MAGRPRLISAVYRMGQPSTPPPEVTFGRMWRLCRDLWIQRGIVAVSPDELPEELSEQLRAWAIEQYGERRLGKKA